MSSTKFVHEKLRLVTPRDMRKMTKIKRQCYSYEYGKVIYKYICPFMCGKCVYMKKGQICPVCGGSGMPNKFRKNGFYV